MTCEMYFGVITAARSPEDPLNVNKYQYEYDVDADGDVGNKIPLRHVVRGELFGSTDEFDDVTLRPGSRVVILAPANNLNAAIIVCALRNNPTKMGKDRGPFRQTRFGKVTQTVDKDGAWILQLDQGEVVSVTKAAITIDNSTGEKIVFDKAAKTITMTAGKDWNVQLGGSMNLTAQQDVLISCRNATVNAQENVTVNAAKKLLAACENAEITASAKVKIKGGTIDLNQATSPITTELSHMGVVDLITNVPVQGVKTIKAG